MEQDANQAGLKPLWKLPGFIPFILVAFINALVDLGHKIVIQNTLFKSYDGPEQIWLTALVNALILMPFILFFSPAGFLSDRFPKARVMQVMAAVAVILALMITLSYYQGWFVAAFSLTFVLAIQSAVYSPAKYGYIREIAGDDRLSAGNGWLQAVTIVAILSGIVFFSLLFEILLSGIEVVKRPPQEILPLIAPLGWLLVLCTLISFVLTLRLSRQFMYFTPTAFDWKAYTSGDLLRRNLQRIFGSKVILATVVGLSLFWSISQVMVAVYPAYVKEHIGELNTFIIQGSMAMSGIGIMLGSIVVARLSASGIRQGLVPIGAILISAGLVLLPLFSHLLPSALMFFIIGFGGALVIVPLNALMQLHAQRDHLGTVLAGSNFLQNIAMLLFLMLTVISAWLQMPSLILLILLAILAVLGMLAAFWKTPLHE
ncbi:MFS transporter [Nitrincola alkalilacustris]|uniref:MFS transporter n=1 Tax=Nitrincola alkalilacustris TaxID=1571224 RepID=UPI00124E9F3D|nr:MFS transporter [Nitrincola alkalilacustris]